MLPIKSLFFAKHAGGFKGELQHVISLLDPDNNRRQISSVPILIYFFKYEKLNVK